MKMAKSQLMGKRIPTLLGLLILIGGLVAGIVLVNMRQGIESKAGPTESPKNIKISNVGSNTFSVSWTTDIPLTGYTRYSDNPAKISLPSGDVRDQISGTSQSYTNHHANITGLSAGKSYYFLIGSGSQTYDDGGKPFQVRTGPQVVIPAEDVIYGKIVNGSATPVNGAIVYVDVEGGETLSTMTKSDGTWRLNLANLRDKDGKVLTYDPEKALLSIFVQSGSAGTATAITDVSKSKPVADIVLGKNQSFIGELPSVDPAANASNAATIESSTATATATPKASGFESQLVAEVSPTVASVKVLNPAIDGEIIATSSPEFRGTALAGTSIKITVQSITEYTGVVVADVNGTWTWTAPQPLTAGNHTLSVDYTDSANVVQKLVRQFVILSAVDSAGIPAFTATPAATITVIPTLTTIPTINVMPATNSGELVDSGTLSTTIFLVLVGVGLVMFGKLSKKWTE